MEQKRVCYIVGAGEFDSERFLPRKEDCVIAADAGLVYLQEVGCIPDLIVGDFDSLGYCPKGSNIIRHPIEKDDTDMNLAVKIAMEKGYSDLYLFGATGGRLDHTLANLQMIAGVCKKGVRIFCFCPDCTIAALTDGSLTFNKDYWGIVSVLAAGEAAKYVSLEGLKYTLHNADLSAYYPLGVSNEFTGKVACISVESGVLWILWQGNRSLPLPTYDEENVNERKV